LSLLCSETCVKDLRCKGTSADTDVGVVLAVDIVSTVVDAGDEVLALAESESTESGQELTVWGNAGETEKERELVEQVREVAVTIVNIIRLSSVMNGILAVSGIISSTAWKSPK